MWKRNINHGAGDHEMKRGVLDDFGKIVVRERYHLPGTDDTTDVTSRAKRSLFLKRDNYVTIHAASSKWNAGSVNCLPRALLYGIFANMYKRLDSRFRIFTEANFVIKSHTCLRGWCSSNCACRWRSCNLKYYILPY